MHGCACLFNSRRNTRPRMIQFNSSFVGWAKARLRRARRGWRRTCRAFAPTRRASTGRPFTATSTPALSGSFVNILLVMARLAEPDQAKVGYRPTRPLRFQRTRPASGSFRGSAHGTAARRRREWKPCTRHSRCRIPGRRVAGFRRGICRARRTTDRRRPPSCAIPAALPRRRAISPPRRAPSPSG